MPKRTDIHSILIIGSGPIVIGQGCEFDYSGVQACRALREEGYRIVLINSNPATIMTDPEFADATYIEPISPESVEKILIREAASGHPIDALLPTLGGQTGLNTGMACFDQGILTRHNVKMIGADREAIFKGEDRQVFKDLMIKIGLKVPRSGVVHNLEDARKVMADIGLPLIIRPAFTLGGTGGGIAYNVEEFETIVARGLDASPTTEVLVEQSVIGWKEFEMEVVRDKNDNCVIICSIENIDAMGVHTGDSITVAPIQTLTDKEYQRMRDASFAVIRAVGVETGGSNIQFGINPENGDMVVIEMNPRVSRSSALASKATGYPIAKIAAKLAVGYTLDELPNYITTRKKKATERQSDEATEGAEPSTEHSALSTQHSADYDLYTSACFEPTIDYCVIKIPRWTFEKFPDADETLTTQMKSVGEAMAIGRTFKEALQKGIRSMEVKRFGFGLDKYDKWLNAQKAAIERRSDEATKGVGTAPQRNTGFQPVPGASGVAGAESSPDPSRSHGLETRVTSGLPPTARHSDDLNADKTTQGESLDHEWPIPEHKLRRKLSVPSQGRLYYVRYALKMGWTIDQLHQLTKIDPWFLAQMLELVEFEGELASVAKGKVIMGRTQLAIVKAKQLGYSDIQLASILGLTPKQLREDRVKMGIEPVYKIVDTCAAEFEASTPYYYSTYETPYTVVGSVGSASADAKPSAGQTGVGSSKGSASAGTGVATGASASAEADPTKSSAALSTKHSALSTSSPVTEDEIRLTDKPKVIIIGGGPNRIGQGIEFDYCCVHAAFACRELGLESVMINSNPETVSTDYDTSDLLFFEPLTHEDILNICERLNGGPFVTGRERDASRDCKGAVPGEAGQPSNSIESKSIDANTDSAGAESPLPYGRGSHGANLVKGVIVQFGGQTPLNLAKGLRDAGVPILGTTVESLDAAGDREQFRELLQKLGLKQPENGIARSVQEARDIAKRIGYPVLVRPSFVLGGRAMEIVYGEDQLNYYMANAVEASTIVDAPILVDKFLDNATEVDVDCVADFLPLSPVLRGEGRGEGLGGDSAGAQSTAQPTGPSPQPSPLSTGERGQDAGQAVIIGVMEHIEEAGIHSGDSACSLPPFSLSAEIIARLKEQTRAIAKALRVCGLMNVQYAIKDNEIYLIEVNPRASRTVPFVGKATGQQWAKIAAKVMCGKSLAELGVVELPPPKHVSVKEVVFPFSKFPGVDIILGPEMRSTGEVMGIDDTFPLAFAKSQLAAGTVLPMHGTIYLSVRNADKEALIPVAKQLETSGFKLIATGGTFDALKKAGVKCERINKLAEGRPHIGDLIKNGGVKLMINTPTKKGPQTDEGKIRSMAVQYRVPIFTTLTAASAAAEGIAAMQKSGWDVKPLQAYHAK